MYETHWLVWSVLLWVWEWSSLVECCSLWGRVALENCRWLKSPLPEGYMMLFSPSVTLCGMLYCPGFLAEYSLEMGMVCPQYLLSTSTVNGVFSTRQSFFFWVMYFGDCLCLAQQSFLVLWLVFWAWLKLYCWVIYKMWNWLLDKFLIFSLIKSLRSDRGGEYDTNSLTVFCEKNGIIHETTAPYIP